MTTTKREKALVVTQLSGGNDYLNTVVPYNEGLYYEFRPTVSIDQDQTLAHAGGNVFLERGASKYHLSGRKLLR